MGNKQRQGVQTMSTSKTTKIIPFSAPTPSAVRFLVMGGTIDGIWDPANDTVVMDRVSNVQKYIETTIKPSKAVNVETITLCDSRQVTDSLREHMLDRIRKSPERAIVVTHGTYTICDTARFAEKYLSKDLKKTVVFTGSMIPLEGFSPSDAPFNLGYATALAQTLQPGIYVSFQSTWFHPDEVDKFIDEHGKAAFVPTTKEPKNTDELKLRMLR